MDQQLTDQLTPSMPEDLDFNVDVAIVGAGLSGLTAAWRLHQVGLDVVVLEAKDRIGGRLRSSTVCGQIVDTGGAWVGSTQDAVLGLIQELGLHTTAQYNHGAHLIRWRGRIRRYRGPIPRMNPAVLLDLAAAQHRLDRLARTVAGPSPSASRRAARLDEQTLGAWITRNTHTRGARFILATITATSFGCRPEELSLLAFCTHITSAGGLTPVISVQGGALERRIHGGAARLPEELANKLGDRVLLKHPVSTIDRSGADHVLLTTPSLRVRAQEVVIATDPATAGNIQHNPELPARRAAAEHQYRMGSGMKVHTIYPDAFWRRQGLSGQAIADDGTVRITFDATSEAAGEPLGAPCPQQPGVLVTLLGAPLIDDPDLLSPHQTDDRRRRVLADLARLFGPDALHPIGYHEQDWSIEPYQSGCVPCPSPGTLTAAGASLTLPVGRLHWAGAESSARWEGHMDGAVRAGQAAATATRGAINQPSRLPR